MCMALGLLGDDSEWYKCLDEGEAASTPNRFQNTFPMIVMENHQSNVPKLFQHYHKQLSEDYQYMYRNLTNERLQPLAEEDTFLLNLYLMHEQVRRISDSINEDVVQKYEIPDINEKQRTRARQIMKYIESVTNMKTLYAENNIDPSILEESASNYKKSNDEQKYFCDTALEIMLGTQMNSF